MAGGLEKTFSVLAKTQNEAAVRILIGALDASDRNIQVCALRALLARRSAEGQRELLRRWHNLSTYWKKIVADSSGRLSNAIRDAIHGPDEQLHRNGCDAALTLHEYAMLPALIAAAEQTSNSRADHSAETLLLLADCLFEELAAPRNYQNRRDPSLVQSHVSGALERSVVRYGQHKRREIVEAYLLLTGPRNGVLNHILQHPSDKAYVTLVRLLSNSPRRGVMRLILDSLNDPRAPAVLYTILARRKDVSFVRHMLKRFADGVPKTALSNLKQIESFSWLCDETNLLSALNGEEQRGAIHLVMASGMSRRDAFEVVDSILAHGAAEARREAAHVLAEFDRADASASVRRALKDDDSLVRATAARQLRESGSSGAMTTLFDLVQSPDEAVRDAARESLGEFTFERFLTSLETLDDDSLEVTGQFVKRVDPRAVDALRKELSNPLRVRRLRAIRMAVAMTAVSEVEPLVIKLLFDEDSVIRAAAAEALVQSPSPASRAALLEVSFDRSEIVRGAAEVTLEALTEFEMLRRPATNPLPPDLSGSGPAMDTGVSAT